jgi:hypothetical protein
MSILDTWDDMTDNEAREAIMEALWQVDRGTLQCMAACVDMYQRKAERTLYKTKVSCTVMNKDCFIIKQQFLPDEDTLKRVFRVVNMNRRDIYGSPEEKRFFVGLDCYLLGRCDGKRLERNRNRVKM